MHKSDERRDYRRFIMMKQSIKPEDFANYRFLSHPDFSPDAKRVVFSVHQANQTQNDYDSDMVLVETDGSGTTRLTYGGKDSSPAFSPDGSSLLFLSKRGMTKDDKGNALYVMRLLDGEPRRVLRREEGIEAPIFSSDGKLVYFLSRIVANEDKDAPKVVKRVPFWSNGLGFVYNSRKHLFSMNFETGDLTQVTMGDFDVSTFRLAHSGSRIGYLAGLDETHSYIRDLFVLDGPGSEGRKLTNSDMSITDFDWSPDDSSIVINGRDVSHGLSSNSRILIVQPTTGVGTPKLTKIEDTDLNKGNSLNSDARFSEGAGRVVWDQDYIYYMQEEGASVCLYRVRPERMPEPLVIGNRSVDDYDVKNGKVVFISMDSTHLQELSVIEDSGDDNGNKERRLTSFNQKVEQDFDIISQEPFFFRASDGAVVDGWVLAKTKDKKLPTIVYVHGGPKTAFGNSYMHEFQVFAAKGYAVLYGNIRGSAGYAAGFADIRKHFGERDYQDLLEMINFATSKFSFLDKDRLAIAGGSYGGFMTNWAIGHTDIFKAAVTDRSISSWRSIFWVQDSPDIARELIGDPFLEQDSLDTMSPLTYVRNIKTPLLIIHSMEDYRCPMSEAVQLLTALKYLGKTVELVLFPGENHDLSRSGKPKHRVARIEHYLRWFDTYLKDGEKATPTQSLS